ncbi:MAG: hypothetical protein DRI73_02170 [Bacteroidetes bacterium]|nr:MAG: hypothetical protein DRI73_02170 [Bacteroidota bacterium]
MITGLLKVLLNLIYVFYTGIRIGVVSVFCFGIVETQQSKLKKKREAYCLSFYFVFPGCTRFLIFYIYSILLYND